MVEDPSYYPLIMLPMRRSPLPWRWIVALVAVLLLLLLVLMAYLDGAFTGLSEWILWRHFLDGPTLVVYALVVYPPLWRLWLRAAQSLQALRFTGEGGSNGVAPEVPRPNRRCEWASLTIGAVFWVSLWQPWGWSGRWEPGAIWLSVYDVFTQTVLFGLLGWLLYSSFVGNRYLGQLSRQHLHLGVFDTGILMPVGRSSLGFSLAFIGGVSLSLVFQTQEDLLMWNNITVYVILVVFTVPLFLLSMWSAHSTMARVKRRELDLVQEHLRAASRGLREQTEDGGLKGTEELFLTTSALVNYERRIKETPEWPFDASIIRRLVASILVPGGVYLIKVLSALGVRF